MEVRETRCGGGGSERVKERGGKSQDKVREGGSKREWGLGE